MTPFELRSLCRSDVTPLKFADAFDTLSEADSPAMRQAALEAAEGRVARAERIMQRMKAEG
jgi:hypothetical protein